MSMRSYGIRGYGVCFDRIANYFDREKALKCLAEEFGETEIEDDGRSSQEILEEILQVQNSVVEFIWAEDTSYILIYECLPWQMNHSDYKLLENELCAKQYIWDNIHEFFDDRLTQEDLFWNIDMIDDTYFG